MRAPASIAVPDVARTPASAAATDVDEGPPTISGGLILAVVGVLLVGLVGALVWALGRDDTPQAGPSASVRSQTDAPTRAVDYPEQPAIDARPGHRLGDVHLELRRRRGGRLLPAAGRRQRGGGGRPDRHHRAGRAAAHRPGRRAASWSARRSPCRASRG